MEGENLKFEDLIVNISNYQCLTLRQLVEALNRQSDVIESIDQNLRRFLNVQAEKRLKVRSSDVRVPKIATPTTPVTPKMETSIAEVKMEDHPSDDPDWECDEKTEIFCHDCKATFIRGTGHFTRHLKFTTCRPYKCYCGKLFKKKSSLTAHKSTHSTNIHKCNACLSTFRCHQYLKNHIRRMHKIESSTDKQNVESELAAASPSDNSTFSPLDLLKLQME